METKLAEATGPEGHIEFRLEASPSTHICVDQTLTVRAIVSPPPSPKWNYHFDWSLTGPSHGECSVLIPFDDKSIVRITSLAEGKYTIKAILTVRQPKNPGSSEDTAEGHTIRKEECIEIFVGPRPVSPPGLQPVTLERSANPPTNDLPLWVVIRKSAHSLSFDNYIRFMDLVLCKSGGESHLHKSAAEFAQLKHRRFLPYNDMDAYRLLKVATEAFVVVNGAIAAENSLQDFNFTKEELNHLKDWVDISDPTFSTHDLKELWKHSLHNVGFTSSKFNDTKQVESVKTILYLKLIRDKLPDVRLRNSIFAGDDAEAELPEQCYGILTRKLTRPCLLELIWSYWHEEAMLVQSMNAISMRFQNIAAPDGHNPLAFMEIDPLRPLNNLIWGFIQDEQHRLSLIRRIYEYDHQYGLTLQGKAVPSMHPADSRSRFLEAFHNLLYMTAVFFKEDDDTTFKADGFPLLNALKEVHLLLAEGASNQFGDLPSTARQEMLIQQWILARPEFREYLPTRIMVALPEPWMDRVDAMKTIQGWPDASVLHFHNLGFFGEQILLSIRFGAWTAVNDPYKAANWARYWRAELQGYIYAYRSVTGVDLTAEITDNQQSDVRYLQPSLHLAKRLATQRGNHPALAMMGAGIPVPVRQRQKHPRNL